MKIQTNWLEKVKFSASASGHSIEMDTKSPIGSDSAMSPKQLFLASICGCTGMDVMSLMRKYRQSVEALEITANAELTAGGHPVVFRGVHLDFFFKGDIEHERALEAVKLSQTQYCGVSAMVTKACPITYKVMINSEEVGSGQSEFDF